MMKDEPRSSEDAFAESIGTNALLGIGKDGLHALAVRMFESDVCELIVVPDHTTTIDDLLHWEHHTGEVRLLFHGEVEIELEIMDYLDFYALEEAHQPNYYAHLADA